MKIIVMQDNKVRLNRFLDWLIHLVGYAIVLIFVTMIFKSIYLDNALYGLWALIAVLIIYILNNTIKPIIVFLTLPITAITLGIFYPFINVIILKIVDFILGSHFETGGVIVLFFAAILISIMNFLMDKLFIETILKKKKGV
ncbi:MAG: phage holin family protein [Bacilli bacterium]|nr:phage holin family protein [Bacilli bacterium]